MLRGRRWEVGGKGWGKLGSGGEWGKERKDWGMREGERRGAIGWGGGLGTDRSRAREVGGKAKESAGK